MEIRPVAYIRTEFKEKFGIPRQSGLAPHLRGKVVFEPEYRDADALRGLEGFSHIWLVWGFSANRKPYEWQPVVRPPRLGGNASMGVFATRSPYRPNQLGLSCVEIESVVTDASDGPVIYVRGADLMDGTPVYDIKPYIRYADSHPDAVCGYVDALEEDRLEVSFCADVLPCLETWKDERRIEALREALSLDPRPSYQDDPGREYGMFFDGINVRFRVEGRHLLVVGMTI